MNRSSFMRLLLGLSLAALSGCECQSKLGFTVPLDAGTEVDAGEPRDSGMVFGFDGGPGCGLVTCASAGASCGPIGDGCGDIIDCGQCALPETCGGGGVASQCGGSAGCVPKTCGQLNANCGPVADGCGGLLNCGSCLPGESCGALTHNRCGAVTSGPTDAGTTCVPLTCPTIGAECGIAGDGCGGILMCGSCTGGKVCGGGGVPYKCGGGNTCVAHGCPDAGATCGKMGDGCGGILDCGTCSNPLTCGGGGVANECGGGVVCVPRTCAEMDAGCGQVGNGCGGLTANCGTCGSGQACGAGGRPNQCGGAATCSPRSCLDAGFNCGPIGDGCGSVLNCGTCGADAGTCGGAGVANVCGSRPVCVPKTCTQLGANCGQVGDGCGGLTADCGSCTAPDICGGAGIPSVCGSVRPDAGVTCTNLCLNQMACGGNVKTTLSGVVYAPTQADAGYGNPDPIPGALVYVANSPVQPFSDGGVTCDQCTSGVSGSPLISTTTALNGSFTLDNLPCGSNVTVPVVIQLGKWRRVVNLQNPACCTSHMLTPEQSRLPRKQAEGNPADNIPLIAMVTGNADRIECVLPKIGIAADQYSNAAGSGRVRFYKDNGANFDGGTTGAATSAATLFDSVTEMKKYDMIVLDCVASEQLKTAQRRLNLESYANAGGRIFASHYAYVWLFPDAVDPGGNRITSPTSFSSTAVWNADQANPPNQEAYVDISFAKGQTFAQWLASVNATSPSSTVATPRIQVNTVRHDLTSVVSPAQRWVYGTASAPGCTAATCTSLDYQCGAPADGCGGTLNCGGCNNGRTCGGGGVAGRCGRNVPTCVAKTCTDLGATCGTFGNGCGGTVTCGTCTAPNTCGGGGTPGQCGQPQVIPLEYTFNTPTTAQPVNQCGRVLFSDFHVVDGYPSSGFTWPAQCTAGPMTPQEKVFEYLLFDLTSCIQPDQPPAQMCTPKTCTQLGLSCGPASDGCGRVIQCGTCTAPKTCGGGGKVGECGSPCTPYTCTDLGAGCGQQGDGCGNTIDCGGCQTDAGITCGGGGVPNQCGGSTCQAKTCTQLGFTCGQQSDGCGRTIDCGPCTAPQTCGGGGVPGQCGGGASCTPRTCAQQGFSCGLQSNGCGMQIDCGPCTAPQTCGGGGVPGVCGGGGTCTARSCAQQGFNCGLQGDGCGNQIDCGTCPAGQVCGLGGAGVCGSTGCVPLTCAQQNIGCGPAGDGCGNLIQCGTCTAPQTCGGGGTPGQCGAPSCTPKTCSDLGAECGQIGNGCGGTVSCGTCPSGTTCGGAGVPNKCGSIG